MGILLKNKNRFNAFLQKRKVIKLKGSTLIETLVATVLIVTIFAIASLALNSIFRTIIQKRTDEIVNTRLHELKYFYIHKKISSNHQETLNNWVISISKTTRETKSNVIIEAIEKTTKKTIVKQFVDDCIE